jgi:hypothetical protein
MLDFEFSTTQPPRTDDPSYMRFCRVRQQCCLAFLDWLRTRPDPDDVDGEVAASVPCQLVRLVRTGAVR